MNKRIAALIVALAMAISFIPRAAFALETFDLRVAGIPVTSEGTVTGLGISGAVTYTAANHMLTLEDATITAPGEDGDIYSGIYYKGSDMLTIRLVAKNSVSKTAGGDWRNALYAASPLTITAETDASLTVTATGGAGGNYGISAHGGLTIDRGDVTAIGGDSKVASEGGNYGIFVENGELEITGGSVTAVANYTTSGQSTKSFGIFSDVGIGGDNNVNGAGNITIKNAIVYAQGGAAETSGGIISKYYLNISGGATVTAVGGDSKETYDEIEQGRAIPRTVGLGCSNMGTVTIKDSTVIATGGSFSFNGKSKESNVWKQVGRSCGVYCGYANAGVITFDNSVVVARAGTVDGAYADAANYRCAVYSMSSKDYATKKVIVLEGTKVAGAAGYDSNTFKLMQDAGIVTVKDYSLNTVGRPEEPYRTAIGTSQDADDPATSVAATGVVIVPNDWTVSKSCVYSGLMELSGDAAIVTAGANALANIDNIEIDTAGHKLAAVSLYEGIGDTAGISANGSFTLSGGGEVIAVGGMTSGVSYGVNTTGKAKVNTTNLTAYGFGQAMSADPELQEALDATTVVAFPTGYEASSVAGYRFMKVIPAYRLMVDGVWVTGMNKSDVLGDGTVSYDTQSATLTLDGATVKGILSEGIDLDLTLNGTNAISRGSYTGQGIAVTGGDLTIRSNGTTSVTNDAVEGIGISVGGSLTVNGSGSFSVAASGSGGTGVLIGMDGKLAVNGGTFTVSGLGQAVSIAPDFTGYAGERAVTASVNVDGSGALSYNEADLATYKYIHIEPVAPPAPSFDGGDYTMPTSVTVYNDPIARNATIWLTGNGLIENDLLITERLTSGSEYSAISSLAYNGDVFRVYDISLRSGKTNTGNPMYLNFDLAESYAGIPFTLVHGLSEGAHEYFYATADAVGDLRFGPLDTLSPFMLVKGTLTQTPVYDVVEIPQTGDSTTPELWIGMLISAAIAAGVAFRRKRKA